MSEFEFETFLFLFSDPKFSCFLIMTPPLTQTVFLLKVPFLLWTLSNCMQCKISANKLGLSLAKLSYHLGFGCTMIKINEWWILTRLTATNHFIPMRMSTYNEQTVWVKSNLWFIKSGLSLVWDEDSQGCSFCGVLQGFLVRNWLWWLQRANQICMKHVKNDSFV